MMAQARLRQEQISITVDFEYLAVCRGDYVKITNDVMLAGGQPARIKSFSGNRVVIDDGLTTDIGVSYGYVYRGVSGIVTSTLNVISSDTFDLLGDIPSIGDLIVIGKVGFITMDCIVKSIIPNDELTATLSLVEKADAVYDAESLMDLPDYTPNLTASLVGSTTPPGEVRALEVLSNTWSFTGSGYQYSVELDWNVPIRGAIYEAFEVYVNDGGGYDLYTITKKFSYRVIIDPDFLDKLHTFKVLAVSANGTKLNLGKVASVSATPLKKVTPPSNVERFDINVTNEVIQMVWPAVTDVDIREYSIRYSPTTESFWESSNSLLYTGNTNTSAVCQARTGAYFIKAVDWNGNESLESAIAITSIPNLVNLNIVTETTEFPALLGGFAKTVNLADSIILQNKIAGGLSTGAYYSEGYYYYHELLDLGDVYTVRLQSLVQAEGYTVADFMDHWVSLDTVALMANANYTQWSVETQVRASSKFINMNSWSTLSGISRLQAGVDTFTPWKTFTISDFTGRIFEFRLKLISKFANVSPRVFEGTIKADMIDRLDAYPNLVTSATVPYVLTYTKAFKGPGSSPIVQVSQDTASSGDRYLITNKTLLGLEIVFYDSVGTQVSRQCDISVKGYGSKSANTV
jgi:hypothetical protein